MFDIFYIGSKPGVAVHERAADSIQHAQELSRTRYLWVLDSLNDYCQFDLLWEPRPWQADQAHVWPSQHQANGGTWLVPKHVYRDINREHACVPRIKSAPRLHIKHRAHSDDQGDMVTRYISDYLGTLRRALRRVDWQHCWVTADVCDYTDFDFTWHPSEWQAHMLHVFASDEQPFGDTFYMHVPTFLEKSHDLALLEWFDTLHFVEDIKVKRHAPPIVVYDTDSVVPAVWAHDFQDPVVEFVRYEQANLRATLNLWREATKAVTPLRHGAESVLIPREVKNHLRTQIYDYPRIDRDHQNQSTSSPQDIVFISYDEPQADENWQRLHDRFPRAHRVHGVAGMDHALVAAAKVSRTPWYFAVFAKTELVEEFDFEFAPDYLQQPKHYIFDCLNTVNGLRYGHMGVVLYNVKYVLEERAYRDLDLDYTLSFPHEVVPELSCLGRFDSTAYHTWRTAFRECAKLSLYNHREPSVDTEYRLSVWLRKASGAYADWCLLGARDGVEFFQECQGELDQIKRSFDWQWLRDRFRQRHGDID